MTGSLWRTCHIVHRQDQFLEELKSALIGFQLLSEQLRARSGEGNIVRIRRPLSPQSVSYRFGAMKADYIRGPESRNQPYNLTDLLKIWAAEDCYPNVHAILSLLLTLLVCSCSFSARWHLKTWIRKSINVTRSNGLMKQLDLLQVTIFESIVAS